VLFQTRGRIDSKQITNNVVNNEMKEEEKNYFIVRQQRVVLVASSPGIVVTETPSMVDANTPVDLSNATMM
jgi:hypothetical protein